MGHCRAQARGACGEEILSARGLYISPGALTGGERGGEANSRGARQRSGPGAWPRYQRCETARDLPTESPAAHC